MIFQTVNITVLMRKNLPISNKKKCKSELDLLVDIVNDLHAYAFQNLKGQNRNCKIFQFPVFVNGQTYWEIDRQNGGKLELVQASILKKISLVPNQYNQSK